MRTAKILVICILCLWAGGFGGWGIAKIEHKPEIILYLDQYGRGYYMFKNLQYPIPDVIFDKPCHYKIDGKGIEVTGKPGQRISLIIKY